MKRRRLPAELVPLDQPTMPSERATACVATPSGPKVDSPYCPTCSRPLTARRREQRYCSSACRFAAWDREHPRRPARRRKQSKPGDAPGPSPLVARMVAGLLEER
jgi:hypothetical protein